MNFAHSSTELPIEEALWKVAAWRISIPIDILQVALISDLSNFLRGRASGPAETGGVKQEAGMDGVGGRGGAWEGAVSLLTAAEAWQKMPLSGRYETRERVLWRTERDLWRVVRPTLNAAPHLAGS